MKFIDGNMDQNVYLNIAKENLDCGGKKLNLEGSFIFQQGTGPKHTAKRVKDDIYRTSVELCGKSIEKITIKNKEDLKSKITFEWNHVQRIIAKKCNQYTRKEDVRDN